MRLAGSGPIEWVEYEPDGSPNGCVNGFAGWVKPVKYDFGDEAKAAGIGGVFLCAWDGEKWSRKFYEEHWPS